MRGGFMMRMQEEEEAKFRLTALNRRYLRLLAAHLKPYTATIIGAVTAMVIASGVALVLPLLLRLAVDRHIVGRDMRGLLGVAGAYAGLTFLQWIAAYTQSRLSGTVGQNVIRNLRRDLYAAVLRNSLSFFGRERVGEIMSRVTNDVNSLSEFVSTGIVHVLSDVMTLAGILMMMFVLDVRLALVTCAAIPVIALGTRVLGRKMRESYDVLRREVAAVNVGVQQGVSGMRVTQSLAREQAGVENLDGLSLRSMAANLKTSLFFAMLFPLMSISNALSTVLVLAYGGSLVMRDAMTVGTLLAFFGYINRFFGPVREMTLVYNSFQGAAASLQRIGEYLDREPDVAPPERPVSMTSDGTGAVTVESVSFRYPVDRDSLTPERTAALIDVNLRIEPGETIALVGPSGAGKTTLALLLARLYDPADGTIEIDGVDVRDLSLPDLRSTVSLVPQQTYLFPGSIGDNIRYGRLDATDDEVHAAAGLAQASGFIEELPAGYDTMVGESGSRLSGGQKQLVSLARTVLANPRILILDEPTANVDVLTEVAIQRGLREISVGRTTFIIAHRFSTVKDARRIVVLDRGKVSGVGSHDELIVSNGCYRSLYEKQWATR